MVAGILNWGKAIRPRTVLLTSEHYDLFILKSKGG